MERGGEGGQLESNKQSVAVFFVFFSFYTCKKSESKLIFCGGCGGGGAGVAAGKRPLESVLIAANQSINAAEGERRQGLINQRPANGESAHSGSFRLIPADLYGVGTVTWPMIRTMALDTSSPGD